MCINWFGESARPEHTSATALPAAYANKQTNHSRTAPCAALRLSQVYVQTCRSAASSQSAVPQSSAAAATVSATPCGSDQLTSDVSGEMQRGEPVLVGLFGVRRVDEHVRALLAPRGQAAQ